MQSGTDNSLIAADAPLPTLLPPWRLSLRHGCYVSGLYLEGAAWDHDAGQLTRQAPKQLVQELPLLQIIPAEVGPRMKNGSWAVCTRRGCARGAP